MARVRRVAGVGTHKELLGYTQTHAYTSSYAKRTHVLVRVRRVVGVGEGPGREVLSLKAPDMPKWILTTTGPEESTCVMLACCC